MAGPARASAEAATTSSLFMDKPPVGLRGSPSRAGRANDAAQLEMRRQAGPNVNRGFRPNRRRVGWTRSNSAKNVRIGRGLPLARQGGFLFFQLQPVQFGGLQFGAGLFGGLHGAVEGGRVARIEVGIGQEGVLSGDLDRQGLHQFLDLLQTAGVLVGELDGLFGGAVRRLRLLDPTRPW